MFSSLHFWRRSRSSIDMLIRNPSLCNIIAMRFFHRKPLLRDPSGFTLLEVLIAIAIIGITLTTLFSSQSQSLSLALESNFNTTAPMLANLKKAELENMEELFDDDGDFGEEFPGYTFKVELKDIDPGESELLTKLQETLQRVDLTVSLGESDVYSYQIRFYRKSEEGG